MCQAQRFERLAHGHRARVRQTQNSDPDLPCSCSRSLLAVLIPGKWKLKLRSDYTLWLLEWGDWLWALGDLFPLLSPFHHLQSTRQLVSFFWNTFHPVSPCSRWIGAWQVTGSAAITSPREAAGLLMSPLECPWASPRAPSWVRCHCRGLLAPVQLSLSPSPPPCPGHEHWFWEGYHFRASRSCHLCVLA